MLVHLWNAVWLVAWPIVGSAAAVGFVFLLSRAERQSLEGERRRLRGYCPTCGYDVRATPSRCPECGTDL